MAKLMNSLINKKKQLLFQHFGAGLQPNSDSSLKLSRQVLTLTVVSLLSTLLKVKLVQYRPFKILEACFHPQPKALYVHQLRIITLSIKTANAFQPRFKSRPNNGNGILCTIPPCTIPLSSACKESSRVLLFSRHSTSNKAERKADYCATLYGLSNNETPSRKETG